MNYCEFNDFPSPDSEYSIPEKLNQRYEIKASLFLPLLEFLLSESLRQENFFLLLYLLTEIGMR